MNSSSKILFMGIDSATSFALDYAKKIGVYTIITDYNTPDQMPLKRQSDEYWMINVGDLDALEERCRTEGVTAVFAGNHEFCLDMTIELCKRLSLPCYASEEGWATGRDKVRFKHHCMECGLDTALCYPLGEDFDPEVLKTVEYPVVVKPSDASSQRGFSLCRNEAELRAGYQRALQYSQSGNIIVEEYVAGLEVDVFYYVHKGVPQLISLYENHQVWVNERLNMSFIPNQSRYYEEYLSQTKEKVEKFVQRLNYQEGALFFQAIRRDGKYYFLEMGCRLDGVGSWVVNDSNHGINTLERMVDISLGRPVEIDWSRCDLSMEGKHSATYLYWARPGHVEKVVGHEVLEQAGGITVVLERFIPGDEIRKTDDMIQIAWFLVLEADSGKALAEKFRLVNENLRLLDENGESLMNPYEEYDFIASYC